MTSLNDYSKWDKICAEKDSSSDDDGGEGTNYINDRFNQSIINSARVSTQSQSQSHEVQSQHRWNKDEYEKKRKRVGWNKLFENWDTINKEGKLLRGQTINEQDLKNIRQENIEGKSLQGVESLLTPMECIKKYRSWQFSSMKFLSNASHFGHVKWLVDYNLAQEPKYHGTAYFMWTNLAEGGNKCVYSVLFLCILILINSASDQISWIFYALILYRSYAILLKDGYYIWPVTGHLQLIAICWIYQMFTMTFGSEIFYFYKCIIFLGVFLSCITQGIFVSPLLSHVDYKSDIFKQFVKEWMIEPDFFDLNKRFAKNNGIQGANNNEGGGGAEQYIPILDNLANFVAKNKVHREKVDTSFLTRFSYVQATVNEAFIVFGILSCILCKRLMTGCWLGIDINPWNFDVYYNYVIINVAIILALKFMSVVCMTVAFCEFDRNMFAGVLMNPAYSVICFQALKIIVFCLLCCNISCVYDIIIVLVNYVGDIENFWYVLFWFVFCGMYLGWICFAYQRWWVPFYREKAS